MDDESLSRLVAVTGPAGSSNVALAAAVTSVRSAAAGSCAVILVEGVSDQSAVEALAARRGRTCGRKASSWCRWAAPRTSGTFSTCSARAGCAPGWPACATRGEEPDFRRGLTRAGLGPVLARDDTERLGFYVCVADLEDDLTRGPRPLDRILTHVRRNARRSADM